MINLRETVMHGLRGQEINFYTGEDVGKNIFLGGGRHYNDPPITKKLMADIGPSLGTVLMFGISDTIGGINRSLSTIYDSFDKVTKEDAKVADEMIAKDIYFSMYRIEIQQFIYLLHKLCYALVLFKADKIIPREGSIPSSIMKLFDPTWPSPYKDQIVESLFSRPESIELFKLSEDINNTFQSFHMFTVSNLIGEVSPTVCAYAPPDRQGSMFTFHNHSVWQLVKGMDIALRDLNIL